MSKELRTAALGLHGQIDDGADTESTQPSESGSANHLVFAVVATALFMGTIDLTIVATALPAIHHDLHTTISWAAWSITVYGLVQIVISPIAGKLSDQFGRHRVFLVAVALFTGASLLCGFANDIYVLIVFRAVQALGGGALQPAASGIVTDHYGKNRDRAIGMFQTVTASGQVIGPLAGGLIVGFLSWRWIFFVNVPIGVCLLFLAVKVIPPSPRRSSDHIDFLGLILVVTLVFAAILGVTNFSNGRTSILDPTVVTPELIAFALLCCFVLHTKRDPDPFIPIRLFRGSGFAAMNAINFLFGITAFGIASLFPLYAEQRYHLHPLEAGTLLTARAVGIIVISAAATFSLRRTGYRLPMIVGFLLGMSGVLLMSTAPRWGIDPYLWLSVSAGITGLGIGTSGPASRNACMQLAPEQVPAIIGLRGMFVNFGIVLSVAVATAILNRSANPGIAQAHIYWVIAAVFATLLIPLVFAVPDHKGSW